MTTRQTIQNELVLALARRAELDEQISSARAMLRALDLQAKEPKLDEKAEG